MIETRDRIIAATNELFRRHGYNGTSLSQIGKTADATIGSIYHFFPGGKEALTVEVIRSTGAVYLELFEAVAGVASDEVAAFADFFDGAAAVLIDDDFLDPCPIGTVAREVASTNDPIRLAAKGAFDSWVDAAQKVLEAGGVAPPTARDLATTFVVLVEGCFVVSRTQRSVEPVRAAGRVIVPLVRAAVEQGVRDSVRDGR